MSSAEPVIKLAIIGNPLEHALSPVLQKSLLLSLHRRGGYEKVECDAETLSGVLRRFKREGYTGFNVTIPHKQRILEYLNDIDAEAEFIGAVNTVRLQENKLTGFNTDGLGFRASLETHEVATQGKTALVFGAGGAARAVCFHLLAAGIAHLHIANRTAERAYELIDDLRRHFPGKTVRFAQASICDTVKASHIVVNTTSVGMWPNREKTPHAFEQRLDGKSVIDIVYNPVKTRFLREAEARGAAVIDGLDMLIFQGVEALKIWLQEAFEFDRQSLRKLLKRAQHDA